MSVLVPDGIPRSHHTTEAGSRLSRHRWVLSEPVVDAELRVLYEDSRIIVADKPHGLATTPRGMWYRQTALMRLRERYGDDSIVPAHRLDRMTAGVVVFIRDPRLRGAYQTMFQERRVDKRYECLAPCAVVLRPGTGTVRCLDPPRVFPLLRRSRIVKERGRLQAYEVRGEVNAVTRIDLARPDSPGIGFDRDSLVNRLHSRFRSYCRSDDRSHADGRNGPTVRRYVLQPLTGKTHQLRVHMQSLGLPIVGDDLYPSIVPREPDDLDHPLQLVARSLGFTDPIDGTRRVFVSRIALAW